MKFISILFLVFNSTIAFAASIDCSLSLGSESSKLTITQKDMDDGNYVFDSNDGFVGELHMNLLGECDDQKCGVDVTLDDSNDEWTSKHLYFDKKDGASDSETFIGPNKKGTYTLACTYKAD